MSAFALPEGMTCADCSHCSRCTAFGFSTPDATECDFDPSRFKAVQVEETKRNRAGSNPDPGTPIGQAGDGHAGEEAPTPQGREAEKSRESPTPEYSPRQGDSLPPWDPDPFGLDRFYGPDSFGGEDFPSGSAFPMRPGEGIMGDGRRFGAILPLERPDSEPLRTGRAKKASTPMLGYDWPGKGEPRRPYLRKALETLKPGDFARLYDVGGTVSADDGEAEEIEAENRAILLGMDLAREGERDRAAVVHVHCYRPKVTITGDDLKPIPPEELKRRCLDLRAMIQAAIVGLNRIVRGSSGP